MTEPCPSCGGAMTEEAERTTRLLIANLDDVRRGRMTEFYGNAGAETPDRLCSACFVPMAGMLNGATSR